MRLFRARSGASPARLAGVVVGVALGLGGCGYRFASGPGVAKVTAGRPVQVPPFENHSLEPDAAIIASQAAARQLGVRGVRLSEGAGLVLTGVIESVNTIPLAPTGPQQISLWRVDARITLELREPGGSKVLARTAVADNQQFLPASDIEGTEVSRRLALHHLLERMATNGVDQLRAP